jgi:hypothetical protein
MHEAARTGSLVCWSALANVEFGGPDMDEMYVTNGPNVYKRKTRVKGVLSWRPPVKPAPPRL